MFAEGIVVAVNVNGKALFLSKLLRDLKGEAEGVVKTEGRFTREGRALNMGNNLIELLKAVCKGLGEFFLLLVELVINLFAVYFKLLIGVFILFNVALCNLCEAAFGKINVSAESYGATDKAA